MAVELIIAVVKGVRLLPDRAEAVLGGPAQTVIGGNLKPGDISGSHCVGRKQRRSPLYRSHVRLDRR
jgi:hypothetical protein